MSKIVIAERAYKWVERCEELQKENTKLKTENKWYSEQLNEAVKKIDRLKEMLKECQYILKEQNFYRNTAVETDTTYRTRCLKKQELLTKINQVLGEE